MKSDDLRPSASACRYVCFFSYLNFSSFLPFLLICLLSRLLADYLPSLPPFLSSFLPTLLPSLLPSFPSSFLPSFLSSFLSFYLIRTRIWKVEVIDSVHKLISLLFRGLDLLPITAAVAVARSNSFSFGLCREQLRETSC
jgi:hypothetical protein